MTKKEAPSRFISYCRVSTQKQGVSGLGLAAQRSAVAGYVKTTAGKLLKSFVEVESGTGAKALANRPQLRRALEECRKSDATLLIARLDRLGRNVHFLSGLMESKVRFVAVDFPQANELTLHMLAAFAQHEAKMISERTKAALAAAKRRGVKLGRKGWKNLKPYLKKRQRQANAFAAKLKGQIQGFELRGLTQREMVQELNSVGVATFRGRRWHLGQLQRVIARM